MAVDNDAPSGSKSGRDEHDGASALSVSRSGLWYGAAVVIALAIAIAWFAWLRSGNASQPRGDGNRAG
ncbi:MAG TPA: hypothetical protein VIV60_06050, partial [Polyangiaceae bacterium]